MPILGKKEIREKEKIEAMYGKEIKLSEEELNSYRTGNEYVDNIIECIETGTNVIYGNFGSGKSTLCRMFSVNAVKCGDEVYYIDLENTIRKKRLAKMIMFYQLNEDEFYKKFHLFRIRDWDEMKNKVLEDIVPKIEKCLLILDGLSTVYMQKFRASSDRFGVGNDKNTFLHDLETMVFAKNIVLLITVQPKSDLTLMGEKNKREQEGSKDDKDFFSGDISLFKHGAELGFGAKVMLRFTRKPKGRYFIIEKHLSKPDYAQTKEKYSIKMNDGGLCEDK